MGTPLYSFVYFLKICLDGCFNVLFHAFIILVCWMSEPANILCPEWPLVLGKGLLMGVQEANWRSSPSLYRMAIAVGPQFL